MEIRFELITFLKLQNDLIQFTLLNGTPQIPTSDIPHCCIFMLWFQWDLNPTTPWLLAIKVWILRLERRTSAPQMQHSTNWIISRKSRALPTELWNQYKIPNLRNIIIVIKILDCRYLLIILRCKILWQTYKNQKWLTSKISIWNCNIFNGKCWNICNSCWDRQTWAKIK